MREGKEIVYGQTLQANECVVTLFGTDRLLNSVSLSLDGKPVSFSSPTLYCTYYLDNNHSFRCTVKNPLWI